MKRSLGVLVIVLAFNLGCSSSNEGEDCPEGQAVVTFGLSDDVDYAPWMEKGEVRFSAKTYPFLKTHSTTFATRDLLSFDHYWELPADEHGTGQVKLEVAESSDTDVVWAIEDFTGSVSWGGRLGGIGCPNVHEVKLRPLGHRPAALQSSIWEYGGCALVEGTGENPSRSVQCWGKHPQTPEEGHGSWEAYHVRKITGLPDKPKEMSLGKSMGCVVAEEENGISAVYCFDEASVKRVENSEGASNLSLDSTNGCFIKNLNQVWCFGGEIALLTENDPSKLYSARRVASFLSPISKLRMRMNEQNNEIGSVRQPQSGVTAARGCAVLANSELHCFDSAVCSEPQANCQSANPLHLAIQVQGLQDGVQDVSIGHDHWCALLSSGAVACWGGNDVGQSGQGSVASETLTHELVEPRTVAMPALVDLPGPAVQVMATRFKSCVLLQDQSLYCFGMNQYPFGSARENAPEQGVFCGGVTLEGRSPNCIATKPQEVKNWKSAFSHLPRSVFDRPAGFKLMLAKDLACLNLGSLGLHCQTSNLEYALGLNSLREKVKVQFGEGQEHERYEVKSSPSRWLGVRFEE
ncbi:MAG: RCC1 domain-containing protein [Bdellovibrionota bacterium]